MYEEFVTNLYTAKTNLYDSHQHHIVYIYILNICLWSSWHIHIKLRLYDINSHLPGPLTQMYVEFVSHSNKVQIIYMTAIHITLYIYTYYSYMSLEFVTHSNKVQTNLHDSHPHHIVYIYILFIYVFRVRDTFIQKHTAIYMTAMHLRHRLQYMWSSWRMKRRLIHITAFHNMYRVRDTFILSTNQSML